MKRILEIIFATLLTSSLFAFESLDFVELKTPEDSDFDTYEIGEDSQTFTTTRWISSFAINKYETTYDLWYSTKIVAEQIGYTFINAGRPGSHGKTGSEPEAKTKDEPVTFITWYDAVIWCNALSQIHGLEPCYKYVNIFGGTEILKDATDTSKVDLAICDWNADGYRLPTEAEWEYAARKVSDGFMPGDLVSGQISSIDNNDEDSIKSETTVAWTFENSVKTHKVGTTNSDDFTKAGTGISNYLGIFDMGGNVLEYCWDWFEERYSEVEQKTRATGFKNGIDRVCRGGSFSPLTIFSSSGDRYHYNPNEYYNFIGFRLARTISN